MGSGSSIREAATTLFLEKGYAGTTMDDIAHGAAVSKQTVYTHFPSKEELFTDLVLANAARVDEFIGLIGPTLGDAEGLEQGLRKLARRYLDFVSRPEVLRLRRLIIGESGRFPDLARQYYERVPKRVYDALAAAFKDALPTDQPMRAAQHFAWLTLGVTLDRGMFYPVETAIDPSDIDRLTRDAVRVFLAAYAR
jgi:TetR/AcrR family transcriptional repressor of mexJK operon